ncbi:MAG TPA: exonuclease subunit SbcD [Bacillota bacterium]|nr:exonuclease subunit SbcD [Bacillota bacterium]
MRILHTSDWHLGRTLEGRPRLPEQEQFIDELIDIVQGEDVKLILIAGDVYDTYNPPADAEKLFFDAMERLSDGGKRAVVAIAGNHDSPERLQAANPLAVKHGISLLGYPGEHLPVTKASAGVQRISSGPGWLELQITGCEERVMVYALPYPSESRLNEVLTENLEEEMQQIAYSERIGRLFGAADQIFRPDTVNVALAHLFAFGGVECESERQLGGALAVSPQEMPKMAQYIALGHLHRPQQLHHTPAPCRYSGSPLSFSFSEADQQKEVVIVDAKPGDIAQVRSINLNSGRILKRWRAGNIEEARNWCARPENQNYWVEMELMADGPLEINQLMELRKLHSGLVTIRPIFPELNETADGRRLSEMTLVERFNLFFEREYGIAPSEDLIQYFLEMVNHSGEADDSVQDNDLQTDPHRIHGGGQS